MQLETVVNWERSKGQDMERSINVASKNNNVVVPKLGDGCMWLYLKLFSITCTY